MFLARADASVAAFPSQSEGYAAFEAAAGSTTGLVRFCFRLIGALSTGLWIACADEDQALMPAAGRLRNEAIGNRRRDMRAAVRELCRCFELHSAAQQRSRGSVGITQVSA
jgi:hypothetical protein